MRGTDCTRVERPLATYGRRAFTLSLTYFAILSLRHPGGCSHACGASLLQTSSRLSVDFDHTFGVGIAVAACSESGGSAVASPGSVYTGGIPSSSCSRSPCCAQLSKLLQTCSYFRRRWCSEDCRHRDGRHTLTPRAAGPTRIATGSGRRGCLH